MAITDNKVTESEINSLHVQAAADSYEGDADENKAIFDRLPEKIAEKHNRLIDRLTEHGRPVQSEDIQQIKVDTDGDVKVMSGGRWQPVAAAALREKADKADTYTKAETQQAINSKVFEIGAGDMSKAVYDSDGDGSVNRADRADNGLFVYTQSESILSGSGANGKFKATAGGRYTAFTIDGQSYAVQSGGEKEIELTEGVWYTFVLDVQDKTINFSSGAMVIPDGATIEPINDVKIWQKCAGLKPVHSTVQAIIADSQTLTSLILNSNAMNYLIRSLQIQEAVLASEEAIAILDKSLPYTTPSMTGNNTPEGTITAEAYLTNAYRAFDYTASTTDTGQTAYSGPGYVQYNMPAGKKVWFYKAQFKVLYSYGTSKIVLEGVTDTGSVVTLSEEMDGNPNTTSGNIIKVALKPNTGNIVAVRIRSTSGTSYINNGRFWGK